MTAVSGAGIDDFPFIAFYQSSQNNRHHERKRATPGNTSRPLDSAPTGDRAMHHLTEALQRGEIRH
jgi:hypothetical protein